MNPDPAERSDTRSDVLADVARSIQAEARLNELRIAVVRVVAYGLVLSLDAGLAALGTRPAGNLLQSGALVTVSVGLLFWPCAAGRRLRGRATPSLSSTRR